MNLWTLDDAIDGKCSTEQIGLVRTDLPQVEHSYNPPSKKLATRRQEALAVAQELHDRAVSEAKAGTGSTAALVSALRKSIELESVLSAPEPGTPSAYVFARPDWMSKTRLSYRNASAADDAVTDVVALPEPEPVDAIVAWKIEEPRTLNAGQSIFD